MSPTVAWEDLGPWKYLHWADALAEAVVYAVKPADLLGWEHPAVPALAHAMRDHYVRGRSEARSDYDD